MPRLMEPIMSFSRWRLLDGCDLIAIAQNHSTEFLEIEHAFQRLMTDLTSAMPERFG
jgi:hypothetical protein